MKNKIIGIFVCSILLFTTISWASGTFSNDSWDLLFFINVSPQTGGIVDHAGAEFDGTYFYTTGGFTSDVIYQFDINGTLVKEFSIPGVSGLGDLAYDGEYFYGGSLGFEIYQMDFETETLVGSFPSSERVRAIAYDSDLDAFYVSDWSFTAALIARDGTVLDSFEMGLPANARFGFAYDNISPDGPYLWVFDQYNWGNKYEGARIYQWDLASYGFTGFYYDVAADLGSGWGIAKGLFTTEDYMVGKYCIGGLMSDSGCPPLGGRDIGEFLFVYELYHINIPPDTPLTPSGPETGLPAIEYEFESFTCDPENDDVYYLFDWGDGTSSNWIGPYLSGVQVSSSHSWNTSGTYLVKVKAKDVHDAESDWSAPLDVEISNLSLGMTITGGVGVTLKIENLGTADAPDVPWQLHVEGGILGMINTTVDGTIDIPAGETRTVSTGLFLGLGPVTVTARADDVEKTASGIILLFFVLSLT